MRTLLVVGWLMVPVIFGAYHFGPGQERLRLDDVGAALANADRQAASEQWAEAEQSYDEALKALPPEKIEEARRIRLERAKVRMLNKKLPDAYGDLNSLIEEMSQEKSANPELLDDTRSAFANAQYYATWLMRLEGEPKEVWEPEIEAARQTYRMLAENGAAKGDTKSAKRFGEDVESAIRLARMDLRQLQGMALPCQCQGCKNCAGQCKGKGKGKKGRSESKSEKKDNRGASSGPPPDGSGH